MINGYPQTHSAIVLQGSLKFSAEVILAVNGSIVARLCDIVKKGNREHNILCTCTKLVLIHHLIKHEYVRCVNTCGNGVHACSRTWVQSVFKNSMYKSKELYMRGKKKTSVCACYYHICLHTIVRMSLQICKSTYEIVSLRTS